MKLNDKVAVVSGGASGIGRATCLALAQAGARVFIGDLNLEGGRETAARIAAAGGQAEALPLDVTKPEAVAAFAAAVHAKVKRADAVISTAGWDRIEPFVKNPPEFWEQIVQINYLGCVRFVRAFLDPMMEGGGGRVVTVASDAGRVGSMGETVYAGAKGGVIAFTKSLAREMARHEITCNVVCPGPTDTPLFAAQPERMREALARVIPLKRVAKPEEIADAIVFFASDRSRYITGQTLSVSGGLTMS